MPSKTFVLFSLLISAFMAMTLLPPFYLSRDDIYAAPRFLLEAIPLDALKGTWVMPVITDILSMHARLCGMLLAGASRTGPVPIHRCLQQVDHVNLLFDSRRSVVWENFCIGFESGIYIPGLDLIARPSRECALFWIWAGIGLCLLPSLILTAHYTYLAFCWSLRWLLVVTKSLCYGLRLVACFLATCFLDACGAIVGFGLLYFHLFVLVLWFAGMLLLYPAGGIVQGILWVIIQLDLYHRNCAEPDVRTDDWSIGQSPVPASDPHTRGSSYVDSSMQVSELLCSRAASDCLTDQIRAHAYDQLVEVYDEGVAKAREKERQLVRKTMQAYEEQLKAAEKGRRRLEARLAAKDKELSAAQKKLEDYRLQNYWCDPEKNVGQTLQRLEFDLQLANTRLDDLHQQNETLRAHDSSASFHRQRLTELGDRAGANRVRRALIADKERDAAQRETKRVQAALAESRAKLQTASKGEKDWKNKAGQLEQTLQTFMDANCEHQAQKQSAIKERDAAIAKHSALEDDYSCKELECDLALEERDEAREQCSKKQKHINQHWHRRLEVERCGRCTLCPACRRRRVNDAPTTDPFAPSSSS